MPCFKKLWILFAAILGEYACNSQSVLNHKMNFTLVDSLGYLGFEFHENKLFALSDLTKSYKKNYLQVFDENGKLLKSLVVPGNFTVISKSKNNALFVGDKDTLLQVFYINDTLKMAYPISTNEFLEFNNACFFMANGYCFTELKDYKKSIFQLYASYSDKSGNITSRVVHTIVDTSIDAKLAGKEKRPEKSYKDSRKSRKTDDALIIKDKKVRSDFEDKTYRGSRNKPYYSNYIGNLRTAMNYKDSTIYFFDHTNGKILQLTNKLEYIKNITMESHKSLENRSFHAFDETNGNFYCVLNMKGTFYVRGYNKETGKILNSNPLPEFYLLDNIRVSNNRLYFLGKQNGTDSFERIYYIDLN